MTMNSAPSAYSVTLAEQLGWTARMVEAVQRGQSLTEALQRVPAAVRPGVQSLTFDALRQWGTTSAAARRLYQRPPAERVRALLCVALGLLMDALRDHTRSRYPAHTVVDQAVAAIGSLRQPHAMAGFVNACLRRFQRDVEQGVAVVDHSLEARWNYPAWWVERVRADHPTHWQAILAAGQQPPPMMLRVNRLRTTPTVYLEQLAASGMPARLWGTDGVLLDQPQPVERLPGWHEGWVSVQDGAAQWAAGLLLDGAPATRVLDACAAPGGKTAHLLERGVPEVVALDKDARRVDRIRDTLTRLGLQAHLQAADAAAVDTWWDGQPFDAILLDAPCTASGIVRRHPDVRWLRRPDDIRQLAAQQRRLLNALWPLLRPGGRLLYCTCSVFKAEGEEQIDQFMATRRDVDRLPAPGHVLPTDTDDTIGDNRSGGTDGFFYALLQRRQG